MAKLSGMHGSFRPLVNPGTLANEIDIEGTREKRAELREELRLRQELLEELLKAERPDVVRY